MEPTVSNVVQIDKNKKSFFNAKLPTFKDSETLINQSNNLTVLNVSLNYDSASNSTNLLEQTDSMDLASSVADSMTAVTPPALLNTDERLEHPDYHKHNSSQINSNGILNYHQSQVLFILFNHKIFV